MFELFCHEHVGAFMELYVDEVVLVRIALSSHLELDILCDKAEVHCPEARFISAPLPFVRASVGSLAWL